MSADPTPSIDQPIESEESEKALLSTVISDPRIVGDVYGDLKPEYFWKETHRFIWRAVESCVEEGHEPTFIAVMSKLDEYDCLNESTSDYLRELHTDFPSKGGAKKHASVIADFYRRRSLKRACDEVTYRLTERSIDYDDGRRILDEHIREVAGDGKATRIGEVAHEVADDVERVQEDGDMPYYSTGIGVVDDVLGGGMYDSRFYLLAARPKHGKTSLAMAIVCGLIRRHRFAVDFWYTDGSRKDIAVGILAHLSGVSNRDIRDGTMSGSQQERFDEAVEEVQDWNLDIKAVGSPDPNDIKLKARSRAAANPNYMCVVDYLQNTDAGFSGSNAGRLNAEAASQAMSTIRTECDCIVLGLAQFNRAADDEDLPRYSQLKFSGQLEQDVNDLLVWHRPDFSEGGASKIDERFGWLNHQLSKHQAAGGSRKNPVDAQLGCNRFVEWNEERVAMEVKHAEQ